MTKRLDDSRQQVRQARIIVGLMALVIPAVLYGAVMALRSTSNDPRQWLPKGFAETDTYDWFGQRFGTDELAVVSWQGCTLDSPRTQSLADALERSNYFSRVRTGKSVLRELTDGSAALSRTGALRRLAGILVGKGGDTTCILLSTSPVGQADRPAAIREIENLAVSEAGLKLEDLRLAGPTVDAAAIDAESRKLLFQLAGLSAIVSFLIATVRLGSVRMAMIVLTVAGYSTGIALAVLYFSGGKMNLLMTMLPPLIYVLSISAAVHLANYYREATGDAHFALRQAIAHGWLPCAMAAITTAIGLASLLTSSIDPIREFGVYSALGVISSVLVLFLLFPALLTLFPVRDAKRESESAPESRFSASVIRFIDRYPIPITLACLAVMAFFGSKLAAVQSTVRLQDRFLSSSDVIDDYRWLEQNIGPMVPLEIVLHFDKDDPKSQLEKLHLVAVAQTKIRKLSEPTATMSAVNLSPPLPTGHRVRDVVQRKLINSVSVHDQFVESRFLSETDDEQLWRISVRAQAIGDLDYGRFAESLKAAIDPLLFENDVRGTYTGIIPLIYKAQRQLLQDLFRSFIAAFAVIAVVMVFMLRGIVAALLAMIPNLFPAVVVFGGLEWVSIPIQIGSVMTASAALGIAVDDTVHFLTWFRRGLDQGLARTAALEQAFARCAGAMMHTTLICSCGLLVFAFSTFVPILHFAWLMVLLLLSALVGDLILLPAILAGPLGRFVKPGRASMSN